MVKKCVAVGDIFITPEMMKGGIEKGYEDMMFDTKYFYFGSYDRHEMRNVVKTIETGGFETLALPEGLEEAMADAEVLMVHLCPVTKKLIEKAPNLKLILCNRGGHENLDIKAASEKGIAVLLNPAHNANAVAEYTVGLMLNEVRNISRSAMAIQKGEWREKYPNTEKKIREMSDMTVGIIGFGTVGRLLYDKLVSFNCKILINDMFENYSGINKNIAKFVSLDELLRESDIVSLHARLSKKSILLGAREFGIMKDTAYFINTARSYMVDYNALANALKTGSIMGAAIDVFDKEPIDESCPLLGLDNVTLTNHRGGDTINSYSDSPAMMMKVAYKYFDGDEPRFCINR